MTNDPSIQNILNLVPLPAHCVHRCQCSCHNDPSARHIMACCTGCGHGHSQIMEAFMEAHLHACHTIRKS